MTIQRKCIIMAINIKYSILNRLFFGKDHCYNSFLNETKVHEQGVDNV